MSDIFKRPDVEAPLAVWEYVNVLERWVLRDEALLAAHRAEFLDECRAHGDEEAAQTCLRDFEAEATKA